MSESQLSLFSLASTRHVMKTIIAMSFLAVLCTMAHAQDPVKTKPAEIWLKVDPGQYIIICWNSGHAKTTPVHPFTVEEVGARDNRPPKEDLVLKLFDFRFELDGTLHQGTQVTRIETPGPSMLEVDIYRLLQGRTVADLNAWRKQQGHGAVPAQALGGALDSHDIHRVVWLRKNSPPGRYVLHCEMPVETVSHPCRCRNGA